MSLAAMELIAGLAVFVIAIWLPSYLVRRIRHGEARFDSEGRLKDDE